MEISKKSLLLFLKHSFAGGFFGVVSFVAFFVVYYGLKPEIEVFFNFYESDNVGLWVKDNFLNIYDFFLNIIFIITGIILSSIGLISAMLYKSFSGKALKILDSEFKE